MVIHFQLLVVCIYFWPLLIFKTTKKYYLMETILRNRAQTIFANPATAFVTRLTTPTGRASYLRSSMTSMVTSFAPSTLSGYFIYKRQMNRNEKYQLFFIRKTVHQVVQLHNWYEDCLALIWLNLSVDLVTIPSLDVSIYTLSSKQ